MLENAIANPKPTKVRSHTVEVNLADETQGV